MIYTYFEFSPYIPLEIISDRNDHFKYHKVLMMFIFTRTKYLKRKTNAYLNSRKLLMKKRKKSTRVNIFSVEKRDICFAANKEV